MSWLKKLFSTFFFSVTIVVASFAQSASEEVEMADAFAADGKIYVVIAVVAVVLSGLLIYLISIDRKVSRLEKESRERKS